MTWPAAVLLVIACGVVALWWLCRYLARQDADEARRDSLARGGRKTETDP
jgi:predicted MFS family arabinose efflux permease